MTDSITEPTRATVAFGRRAVPQLFEELQQPEAARRLRALRSLCDLLHGPERVYQTVRGGFLEQLKDLLMDEDPAVRSQTCVVVHLLTSHSIGRQAVLSSSLLDPLCLLLGDSCSSCRRNAHQVLNHLKLPPAGAAALLPLVQGLVPRLMLTLREEEEEEMQVLLLSTLTSCSWLDPLPALCSDAVSLLGLKLSHPHPHVRREAAAAMMALSVCEVGRRQVCEEAVLPVLVDLLRDQDQDLEVQTNAAGVLMYTVILTAGKRQCLDLDAVPVLLNLLEEEQEKTEGRRCRKTLVLNSLRALTSLAEAPDGRRLLQEKLPLLERRSQEEDLDIRRAASTAVSVVTWRPY